MKKQDHQVERKVASSKPERSLVCPELREQVKGSGTQTAVLKIPLYSSNNTEDAE